MCFGFGEFGVGVAQKQQAENGTRIFGRLQPGIGPKLIRHGPQTSLDFGNIRRHQSYPPLQLYISITCSYGGLVVWRVTVARFDQTAHGYGRSVIPRPRGSAGAAGCFRYAVIRDTACAGDHLGARISMSAPNEFSVTATRRSNLGQYSRV